MSFSSKVKNEICRYINLSDKEALAELSAIMRASGTLTFAGNRKVSFKISTENAAIARLVFRILKCCFNVHTKIMIKRSNSFKKNNVYIIVITEDMNLKTLLKETEVLKENDGILYLNYDISDNLLCSDEAKRAYIRGAFLGGGSISNPEKTYHLEFVTHNEDYAKNLSKLINSYKLLSKVIQRKNSYIVYIKEGEQITN